MRHTIATVAYRAAKALRDAPDDFAELKVSDTSRTPIEILLHIGDLFDWALSMAKGKEAWHEGTAETWQQGCDRFFASLKALDEYLASDEPLACTPEKLFQGPVADALTHIGQIAMLRRIGGGSVRGENYARADIQSGRVGSQQAAPRREFK